MEAEQFLKLVLARTGYICIATPSPNGKGYWHHVADTPEAAAKIAERELYKGKDVFYAVGTLKERSVLNPTTGKKSYRTADNISHFKCWIVDLDVGKGDHKYPDQLTAIKALIDFCKATGIPQPMVVSSGYGIHAYWLSTFDVPADLWKEVALKFKALMAAYGLLVDPSRTSDVSSVLRVVGTANFKDKDNPKPVEMVTSEHQVDELPTDPALFLTLLEAASDSYNVPPPIKHTAPTATGLGSFDTPTVPADIIPIAKGCAQMNPVVATRGNVNQTLWFRALGVIRLCKFNDIEGEALCHELSKGHPDYSPADTDAKIQQVSQFGPTLCATFEKDNPKTCKGCLQRGKINSPIVLGRVVALANAPKMEILGKDGESIEVDLPNPPDPWVRTKTGKLGMKLTSGEGKEFVSIFYDYDLHPTKRLLDDTTGHEIFYFRTWLPMDGWREFEVPATMMYDDKALFHILASRGVLPDLKNKGLVTAYMHAYMKHLQKLAPAESIYSQMGWKKENTEFILGDTAYKSDGTQTKVRIDGTFKSVLSNFESKGSLAEWQKVIEIYKEPGHEDLALSLMIGLGSPMFHFSGFEGGVFSLNGKSGAGKSTILSVIHSIYGKPTCNVLLRKDTSNSKAVILSAYNNLPVTFDEITSIGGEEASQLVFDVTDGRDKQRLNSDASLKHNTRTWGLILFTTTNRSLPQLVLAHKPEASGEMMRILERRINPLNRMEFADARKRFAPLDDNYGLAGPIMLKWYVENLDESKRLLNEYTDKLSDAVKGQVPERFWLSMCATGLLGCHVGNLVGVHDFDFDATFRQTCTAVIESRQSLQDHSTDGVSILTDFINNHLNQIVVVMEQTAGAAQVRVQPRGDKLCMRSELGAKMLYIDTKAMLRFCSENGYDFGGLQKELMTDNVIVRPDAKKCLTEGTEIDGGSIRTWAINVANPTLSGAVPTLVTSNKQPDAATG